MPLPIHGRVPDTLVVGGGLAPMLMLRPGELRQAECDHLELDAAEWRSTVSKTKSEHIVPVRWIGGNTGEVHPSVRVRGLRTHLGAMPGSSRVPLVYQPSSPQADTPPVSASMRPVHQLAEDRPSVRGALLRR